MSKVVIQGFNSGFSFLYDWSSMYSCCYHNGCCKRRNLLKQVYYYGKLRPPIFYEFQLPCIVNAK